MPNTLVHLGIQGFSSRWIIRNADFKWIALGILIPDLPWLFQRFMVFVFPYLDRYSLRLYFIVQASLLFCLVFSAACGLMADNRKKALLILFINVVLHLILDAWQIKWANGVHFFAPLSWKLMTFGFFWPESGITDLLTATGPIFMFVVWKTSKGSSFATGIRLPRRWVPTLLLLAVYFVVPATMLNGPASADNHYVRTLQEKPERIGKKVAFDRARYQVKSNRYLLTTFAGETLELKGMVIKGPALVSVKGIFITPHQIRVTQYHIHSRTRDLYSYVGLIFLLLVWVLPMIKTD